METLVCKYFSLICDGSIYVTQYFAIVSIILISLFFYLRSNGVYLVDYVCYSPPNHLRVPHSHFVEHSEFCNFDQDILDFEMRVLERSGIGDESCMPPPVHEIPPNCSLRNGVAEMEMVLFEIVKDLLSKHNVHPKSIDILVSNCSLFCPTPSIPSMIINRFGLRSNIKSFNLSGMGCSAGILSISLVKDLLRVYKNSLALVLTTEAIAPNGYQGKSKSKIMTNVLFRMGGAAILISNRKQDKKIAKYELQHLVRTHLGSDEKAYKSVYQDPDKDGVVGVSLSRELLRVAGSALRTNMRELGPLVLPYSELLRYVWSAIQTKLLPSGDQKKIYLPNFRKAFQHFCIHAGGKSVIDAIEESLKLQKEDGEASRMALYRFGNTSSSSVWYELCYLEAKGKVKKGDRVWQIGFGSGFKCNSAAWKCIADIDPNERNAWSGIIHSYPIEIPVFDC
ncbi:hypothetical protein HN51_032705 [Arachis hypogaea]